MQPKIERATVDDGPAILRLLSTNELPREGLLDHIDTALVARDGSAIVGCAALEIYPDGALLRSVAVDLAARGRGVGSQLTASALDLASSLSMPAVYLLTTTAEGFFPKFGFERITREDVPASVRNSVEFRSACPSTAIVMKRALSADIRARGNLPVVCTLQPGELNARASELLTGLAAMAKRLARIDGGYQLEFEATTALLQAIAVAIEAERQCCRFLRFQLTVEPDHGPLFLVVTGPAGTREFLSALLGVA
jgi:amino-acid N-acetyltransferase